MIRRGEEETAWSLRMGERTRRYARSGHRGEGVGCPPGTSGEEAERRRTCAGGGGSERREQDEQASAECVAKADVTQVGTRQTSARPYQLAINSPLSCVM